LRTIYVRIAPGPGDLTVREVVATRSLSAVSGGACAHVNSVAAGPAAMVI